MRRLLAEVILGLLAPSFVFAQNAAPDISGLGRLLTEQNECFSGYKYGGVRFEFTQESLGTFSPGQTIKVAGKAMNQKAYPLTQGRIAVRVLRHNKDYEPKNWHTYVAEANISDQDLQPNGSRDFNFEWKIPAMSPGGTYQIDFFYLSGDNFVISGIPYVTNMPGGRVLFNVIDSDTSAAVSFDRNHIVLSGKTLEMRAVPPQLPANKPISVQASLIGELKYDNQSVPAILTTALYKWSDSDLEAATQSQSKNIVITNSPQPVTFDWDKPVPGVYELVFTAQPMSQDGLPAILKVRFAIDGNVPRVIFAGITDNDGTTATITTCVVNSTFTDGQAGGLKTAVLVGNKTIGETKKNVTNTASLFASKVKIPAKDLASDDVTVKAEAYNEQGEVTDSRDIYYLNGSQAAARGSLGLKIFVVVATAVIIALFFLGQRRKTSYA